MKKRILFVEDERLLLEMYVMMLDDERDHWDVATAADGTQALALMEQAPFDVVVSDLNMPGMSGLELLTEVRKRYPRSSRIIVSGLEDKEEAVRCLGAIHQFLAKPFQMKTLKATLARVGGLDSYLNNPSLQGLVSQLGTLPSFPSLYVEIMKELDSESSSTLSLTAIITRDPGMTAKILQIVNSAAIGLSHKVTIPFEAIQFLGHNTVRSLVLSAHIFSCFDQTHLRGFSITRLWNHAMKCGMLARRILQIEQVNTTDTEEAHIAGMLHDVGKLMLADNMPEQFERARVLAAERGIPLHEAELEVFGATHAGAAAYLLGLWGLPATIVEAVAFHHTPQDSGSRLVGPLTAVHAANVLEQELSKTKPLGKPSELDADYLAAVGVLDRVDTWRAEAARLISSLRGE